MTDQPRRRAKITGTWVFFESRNPELATVRWHPRFRQRYRTKADALEAKQAWEKKGRIMFPGDFKKQKIAKASNQQAGVRVRVTGLQQEMRL